MQKECRKFELVLGFNPKRRCRVSRNMKMPGRLDPPLPTACDLGAGQERLVALALIGVVLGQHGSEPLAGRDVAPGSPEALLSHRCSRKKSRAALAALTSASPS
jgi:hypothetical protein